MRTRSLFLLGLVGLLAAAGIGWALLRPHSGEDLPTVDVSASEFTQKDEQAGLCPWRDPEGDRKRFFPASSGYEDELAALSSQRPELQRRLGRPLTGEDNAVRIHRILAGQTPVGAIVTRRVRGESGVIEMVLAVGLDGRVVGARLQRLREPDSVAAALQSPAWLGAFRGKTADSAWRSGQDIPNVPAAAHSSAEAILDGAHSILVMLALGHPAPIADLPHTH
ncbi:MAG TPA: hypothetical protein VFA07_12265 [Chthonomonadaceae bacterium]|nr:hypothetical protein [Chthonomonadaceae bacterium]